jgi:hypothetical protein
MNRRLVAAASIVSPLLTRSGATLLKFATVIWVGSCERYHPENHYMRGPGPKWREKYGLSQVSGDLARAPVVSGK